MMINKYISAFAKEFVYGSIQMLTIQSAIIALHCRMFGFYSGSNQLKSQLTKRFLSFSLAPQYIHCSWKAIKLKLSLNH